MNVGQHHDAKTDRAMRAGMALRRTNAMTAEDKAENTK